MITDIQVDVLPRALNTLYDTIVRMTGESTPIPVQQVDDTWLIKVNTNRCRLCGHMITVKLPECDPWYEGYNDD